MKTILLLSLLIISAISTTTYTSIFSTLPDSIQKIPSYPLGYLEQNKQLLITVQLPNPQGVTLASGDVVIQIMASDNSQVVNTFTTCTGTTCDLTWTIPATDSYFLQVFPVDATLDQTKIVLVSIIARYQNARIVSATDILRQSIIKYIFVSTPTTLTFTLSPVSDPANSQILIYPVNNFAAGSPVTLSASGVSSLRATYQSSQLARGFYAIKIITPDLGSVTLNHQSVGYICPYSQGLTDTYGVFRGCSFNVIPQVPSPCVIGSNGGCVACVGQYRLFQNRVCVYVGDCGPRQYISFTGACATVSPACGEQFDPYTGQCITCAAGFTLVGNRCVGTGIVCPSDTFLIGGKCISILCGNYDLLSGLCTSCVNTAYFLSNGRCFPLDCGVGRFWSVALSACTSIPQGCTLISLINQNCDTCSFGYVRVSGTCISARLNCARYNSFTGLCQICSINYDLVEGYCRMRQSFCPTGFVQVNGVCTLANCNTNQQFVNGQCYNLPQNCQAINSILQCVRCKNGFSIQAGICKQVSPPNILCPSGFFLDSFNVCRQISLNCQTSDPVSGRCTSCVNGQNPVDGICCPNGQTVQGGICSDRPTNNPSSGGATNALQVKYGKYCARADLSIGVCLACTGSRQVSQSGRCD